MKILSIMFVSLCLQTINPGKDEKKPTPKPKKEAKQNFNKLAPSILIINY